MVQAAEQFIKGNRRLSPAEVDMINEVKDLEEFIFEKIAKFQRLSYVNKRWLAMAKTDFQRASMSMVRSIAEQEGE